MVSFRVQLSPQERAYYETLFALASPDTSGNISGRAGAQFLETSGLSRDVLHKVWSIADNLKQGRLDKEAFFVSCRLVAHCQSGLEVAEALVSKEPSTLPVFGSSQTTFRDTDTVSVSDIDGIPNLADTARASNIALSLRKLGLDPLEFVPFQSGPETAQSTKESGDWSITEAERQKYVKLFRDLDNTSCGYVAGNVAKRLLEKSGLSKNLLALIWEMSDRQATGRLSEDEFAFAMHLSTKCKKGLLLPNKLPDSLLQQIFGTKQNDVSPKSTVQPAKLPDWKYSRTYLKGENLVNEFIGDADAAEEELRHIHDMCLQVESDIRRMKVELGRRDAVTVELENEKRALTESKQTVGETRRRVNIDKVSFQRDRAKLQSEIVHLNKLIRDGTRDTENLRHSVMEAEKDVDRIQVQTKALTSQRNDAVKQLQEELGKIECEQRETGALVDTFTRLNREDEIRLESERIAREKNRVIQEMQRKAPSDVINLYVPIQNSDGKWSTTMLTDAKTVSSKKPTHIGFGTSFFHN